MRLKLLTAVAMVSLAGASATAQMSSGSAPSDQMQGSSMSSGSASTESHMRMTAADKKMMARCKGMSHAMMMKNRGCKKMMKMHPDMMRSG